MSAGSVPGVPQPAFAWGDTLAISDPVGSNGEPSSPMFVFPGDPSYDQLVESIDQSELVLKDENGDSLSNEHNDDDSALTFLRASSLPFIQPPPRVVGVGDAGVDDESNGRRTPQRDNSNPELPVSQKRVRQDSRSRRYAPYPTPTASKSVLPETIPLNRNTLRNEGSAGGVSTDPANQTAGTSAQHLTGPPQPRTRLETRFPYATLQLYEALQPVSSNPHTDENSQEMKRTRVWEWLISQREMNRRLRRLVDERQK